VLVEAALLQDGDRGSKELQRIEDLPLIVS